MMFDGAECCIECLVINKMGSSLILVKTKTGHVI